MGRSQAEKMWILGTVIVAALLALIAYTLVISPQRGQTSQAEDDTASARSQVATLQARLAGLAKQDSKRSVYAKALRDAELALPQSSGMAQFLHSLQTISTRSATTVTALTVGTAQAPTTAPTASSPSGATPSATAPAAPAASAAPQAYAIPVTATVTGPTKHLDAFLVQLQTAQPRAVLVSQLTLGNGPGAPGGAANTPSLVLTMSVFERPAAGSAPTSAVTPTPSAGG